MDTQEHSSLTVCRQPCNQRIMKANTSQSLLRRETSFLYLSVVEEGDVGVGSGVGLPASDGAKIPTGGPKD